MSVGSNVLRFEFAGDSYYSVSYQEVSVTVNAVSLVLSSDKSVLSYADSESASITCSVIATNPIGQSVTMGVYKSSDDSLVTSLSVTDNGDGTYSASYTSQGVGDVYVKAECMLVSETYSIEDCNFNDTGATDRTSIYDTTYLNNGTFAYDSSNSCYYITANQGNRRSVVLPVTVTGSVKFEADIQLNITSSANRQCNGLMELSNSNFDSLVGGALIRTHSVKQVASGTHSNMTSVNLDNATYTTPNIAENTWYHIVMKATSSNLEMKVYDGDTLVETHTLSHSVSLSKLVIGAYCFNYNMKFKNVKVKPL